ncbi:MAG TPA: phospholipase D-like domain-containing protein [Bacteroidia bacterium]|jgi:phosphatidylserine/phosphatidylglycerophosphate/cardiolipin synthase-like enzyme|nr:phospholipase D-like domain-containing protein [Bacteroidia bacterium]
MKKTITLIILGISFQLSVKSQVFTPAHKINVYFNSPVDTTVAVGPKAIALLNSTAGDTMIAYINRAKYTLDFCYFDFTQDSAWFEEGYIPPISRAITAAYNRGVKIRFISNNIDSASGFCNAFTPNYGLDSIPAAIPKINRPASATAVMHNKFIVIDGRSSNPNDPIVWGGSMNIEPGQIAYDLNNIVIIQDSGIAHAYLGEFNQIWGDTVEGGPSVVANQKWGSAKKFIGNHHFLVGTNKIPVEVYFSPEDSAGNPNYGTNYRILSTMSKAKSEIDVAMYAFSYAVNSDSMIAKYNKGIFVSCVIDGGYSGDAPYAQLSNAIGADVQLYNEGTKTNPTCKNIVPQLLMHNKYMIVDPCNWNHTWGAQPIVETGSHNWSSAANTVNDENIMIIHDSAITNLFYQAYVATFKNAQVSQGASTFVGLQAPCYPIDAGVNELPQTVAAGINLYPNPANTQLNVSVNNMKGETVSYQVYNLMGQTVLSGLFKTEGINNLDISSLTEGVYMLTVQNGTSHYSKKFSCIKH